MAWVKIDDSFADHPKVVSTGPLGMALQVAALCYCNRYLTDGFIPYGVAHRLVYFEGLADSDDVIARMVKAGIWVDVEGGYQIHDYLEYQPSRAEVEETREKRRAAGAKGGRANGKAKDQAKPKQSTKHEAKQNESKVLSKSSSTTLAQFNPVPVPVPNINTQEYRQTDIGPALHVDAREITDPNPDFESVRPSVDDPLSLVTAAYHAHIGMLGPSQFEQLRYWHDEMGMSADVVVEAILEAKEQGKTRINYIEGILRHWHNDGVTTVEEARERRKPRVPPKARGEPGHRSALEEAVRKFKETEAAKA